MQVGMTVRQSLNSHIFQGTVADNDVVGDATEMGDLVGVTQEHGIVEFQNQPLGEATKPVFQRDRRIVEQLTVDDQDVVFPESSPQ